MKTSAMVLTWNEKDFINPLFDFCESMKNLDEIVIVDSYSTDGTLDLIKNRVIKCNKEVKVTMKDPFEWKGGHFYAFQRNYAQSFITGDWFFELDADETYSNSLDDFLLYLKTGDTGDVVAFNVGKCMLFKERNVWDGRVGLSTKIFKTGKCRYRVDTFKFDVINIEKNRSVYVWGRNGEDVECVWNNPNFKSVLLKNLVYSRSEEREIERGKRYADLGLLVQPEWEGYGVGVTHWRDQQINGCLEKNREKWFPLPEIYHDITTERKYV